MDEHSINRPVALLVEDTPELLRARQHLFNVSGFQAICVSTAVDALREFIATPAVDIIIADINLDRANEDDVSGVDVAATIREMRPDLPIVAVSGRIDSLLESQRRPFTDTLVKGKKLTAPDFDAKLEKWRDDAIAYRERRSLSGKRAVAELEANDDFQPIDYQVIREFLPGRHPVDGADGRRAVATPEEVLREAGWWLQLVQAGKPVAANGAGGARTQLAVLVWVRSEGAEVVAVLHGFSSVSYRGSSCDEAVEGLFKILYGCHSGALRLENVGEAERQQLRTHLAGIFG
jgi:CheY-like chemotaxis protein